MTEPFFSIIVPIYNVALYIEDCLYSILNQTYGDFEILCVDDEGQDESMRLVELMASNDSRIRILHHPHGGLPSTRNVGLENAKGKYIILVDGDDMLKCDHLIQIKSLAEQYDFEMCISNTYTRVWAEQSELVRLFPLHVQKADIIENSYSIQDKIKAITDMEYAFPSSAWLTVYSKKFLDRHQLRYDESLVCSEDADFFLQALAAVEKMSFSQHEFYLYRQDNGAAMTKNMTADMFSARIQIDQKWYDYFERHMNPTIAKRICDVLKKDISGNIQYILRSYPKMRQDELLRSTLKNSLYIWRTNRSVGYVGNMLLQEGICVYNRAKALYYATGKQVKKKLWRK